MRSLKTNHDLRSVHDMPPAMGLRSEASYFIQIQRLSGERVRLTRELALARERVERAQMRLHDVAATIEKLYGLIHPPSPSPEPLTTATPGQPTHREILEY
jgi:hypothetical protein